MLQCLRIHLSNHIKYYDERIPTKDSWYVNDAWVVAVVWCSPLVCTPLPRPPSEAHHRYLLQ